MQQQNDVSRFIARTRWALSSGVLALAAAAILVTVLRSQAAQIEGLQAEIAGLSLALEREADRVAELERRLAMEQAVRDLSIALDRIGRDRRNAPARPLGPVEVPQVDYLPPSAPDAG